MLMKPFMNDILAF